MTFVDDCRREWKQLGVPDAVANEMAAELAADLTEAEAEGASAEEVLGYAVFDAPAFAAQWAEERGVIRRERGPRRRPVPIALVVAVALCLVVVAAGVATLVGVASTHAAVTGAPHMPLPARPPGRVLPKPPPTAGLVFLGIGLGGVAVVLTTWLVLDRRRRVIL